MTPFDEREEVLDPEGDGTPVDDTEEMEVARLREENVQLKKAAHNREGFEVREARRLQRLEDRLNQLTEAKTAAAEDEEIYDPTVRDLKRQVHDLRNFVAEVVKREDPELNELEPYMAKVQEEHPELLGLKDPQLRLRAIKVLARDEKVREAGEATSSGKSGRNMSRAFRETGGVTTGGPSPGPSMSRLESLLEKAGSSDERARILDDWQRKYPDSAAT